MISNSLQDSVLNSDILTSLSSDHSPVLVSFDDTITESKGSSYWKFNSLLLKNPEICAEIIDVIEKTKREFESIDPQLKWELVKYKVRCVCINASKRLAKEKKRRTEFLENSIDQYENSPLIDASISPEIYSANKLEFEALMDEKTNGHIQNGLV